MNPTVSDNDNCFVIPPLPPTTGHEDNCFVIPPLSGPSGDADTLRTTVLAGVGPYVDAACGGKPFVPGVTPVPVSGNVFDADDVRHLVDASLGFWLTTGRFAAQLEAGLAAFMGCRSASLVNSGLSANLLAVSALTSAKLGDRRLHKGDEIITVATGFPTIANPIIQNGLVPVFVDVNPRTYNIDATQLETARSPHTRAVILAHTLGNPFDLGEVTDFCQRHNLFLIEDCRDAVGSTYNGRNCGTFGDLATASFYPADHLTMGESGAVLTNQPVLKHIVQSFRDRGSARASDIGKDNLGDKRFDRQPGDLSAGPDHEYTYSHIGYNVKATDMQAAVGVSQLAKLPGFIEARKRNFRRLYEGLAGLEDFLVLPEQTPGSDPSWFGFPLAVRSSAPFTREQIIHHLESRKIATRLLFGANLLRQPAYQGVAHRKVDDLSNSDWVMRQAFWLGVYPGLTPPMLDFVVDSINAFCAKASRGGALAA